MQCSPLPEPCQAIIHSPPMRLGGGPALNCPWTPPPGLRLLPRPHPNTAGEGLWPWEHPPQAHLPPKPHQNLCLGQHGPRRGMSLPRDTEPGHTSSSHTVGSPPSIHIPEPWLGVLGGTQLYPHRSTVHRVDDRRGSWTHTHSCPHVETSGSTFREVTGPTCSSRRVSERGLYPPPDSGGTGWAQQALPPRWDTQREGQQQTALLLRTRSPVHDIT